MRYIKKVSNNSIDLLRVVRHQRKLQISYVLSFWCGEGCSDMSKKQLKNKSVEPVK